MRWYDERRSNSTCGHGRLSLVRHDGRREGRRPTGEDIVGMDQGIPQSQEMYSAALELAWTVLKERHTTALLVIRHDRIVFERYAPGYGRTKPHSTASMAKALVAPPAGCLRA